MKAAIQPEFDKSSSQNPWNSSPRA